ncbi:MAG: endonuclease/exonuclease/phosphatase family protein [Clostridiales bacterium]|nr:endonuclease/exonuclease/phosphatase family protein [Clostridiales bacterium]
MRRAVVFLLVALTFFAVFTGCVADGNKPQDENETGRETTTQSQIHMILMSELANYSVVRPEAAGEDEKKAAVVVWEAIKEISDKVRIKDDFVKEGFPEFTPGEYEILVGNTNREETAEFLSDLRADDYGYRLIGKKLVIAGHSEANTYRAAVRFVENVVERRMDSDIFYSSGYDFLHTGNYPVDSFRLNGIDLGDYVIVYKNNGNNAEALIAESLRHSIVEATGYYLRVYSDKEKAGDYEILIGRTSRDAGGVYSHEPGDTEYVIGAGDRYIVLYANNIDGHFAALGDFIDRIKAACETGREAELSIGGIEVIKDKSDLSLSAMSFNVYVSNMSAERVSRVLAMVEKYLPDTVGFQEASPAWMNQLRSRLSAYYSYVGAGRDGGDKGEYNPIFYRKDKFTLLDSGTKWLSATPDKVSKFSESSLNRIFTYAVLKRSSDGRIFVHINTHFDHKSNVARVKQAEVLKGFIEEFAQNYPVILTGDFNCKTGTDEYKIIDATSLVSSRDIAIKKENDTGTYHGYRSQNNLIDFVFVSETGILVKFYKVANEQIDGDYASDHHPVYIEYFIT